MLVMARLIPRSLHIPIRILDQLFIPFSRFLILWYLMHNIHFNRAQAFHNCLSHCRHARQCLALPVKMSRKLMLSKKPGATMPQEDVPRVIRFAILQNTSTTRLVRGKNCYPSDMLPLKKGNDGAGKINKSLEMTVQESQLYTVKLLSTPFKILFINTKPQIGPSSSSIIYI